ncbi:MAG: hypothetical protein L6V84_00280 [Oscillospiraceae bacterium]|nr:MAG: hypothetical protein L6V84_00280 [Oscillospiraceae bacterium]
MLLPGHRYYAYRCVVSNEFSEVITDEVTLELLFNPYFYDIKRLRYDHPRGRGRAL